MKGHYYKRGCMCGSNDCTCGKKWSFMVDIGRDPRTGKRRQKGMGGFNTKKEAEVAAASLITELNSGTFIQESDFLFKDFTEIWLRDYIERNSPKPSTIRIRKHGINRLLPYLSQVKLKNITEEMYQEILNDLKEQGLARNTLKTIHAAGSLIFKTAVQKRMIKISPAQNAYIKKDPQTIMASDIEEIPSYFEKEELLLLLQAANEIGLYMDDVIFLLLAYTGMRLGELIALQWDDIDFDKNVIHITKTYYNETNNTKKFELQPPKTRKSRRKIVVDEIVIDALITHKKWQTDIISHFGRSYYNQGFIFANANQYPGYPITLKFVGDRMKRLIKKGNLNLQLTPHSLRHTHTSLLAEAGVEIEDIKDRLGHMNDETTKRVYLHVTAQMKKEASNKFSKLMQGLK